MSPQPGGAGIVSDWLAGCRDSLRSTQLEFEVVSCDGGDYDIEHSIQNALVDDQQCYCSLSSGCINVVLRARGDGPFLLTTVSMEAPERGYTSPLESAAVFVLWDAPDLRQFVEYDFWEPVDYANAEKGEEKDSLPVAFCVLDDGVWRADFELATPRVGRYLLVKLLRAKISYTEGNVDLQYMGFRGRAAAAPLSSAFCETCTH